MTADQRPAERLTNGGGELIAEGPCWVDNESRIATMEPERTPGVIQKQAGYLSLELDTGRTLRVFGRAMVVRIWSPERGAHGQRSHRSLYRLRLVDRPGTEETGQDASAAGAVGEGAPTSPQAGPRFGETSAAR